MCTEYDKIHLIGDERRHRGDRSLLQYSNVLQVVDATRDQLYNQSSRASHETAVTVPTRISVGPTVLGADNHGD